MKKVPIFVGFSINPEICFSFDSNSKENKVPLIDAQTVLGGSGFNTAMALSRLGIGDVFLTGLVGEKPEPFRILLDALLQGVPFRYAMIEALEKTSLAFLPVSNFNHNTDIESPKVIGRRGNVRMDCIGDVINKVKEIERQYCPKICLALGIQKDEIKVVENLFEKRAEHINVLVLSTGALQACGSLEVILGMTDFLFMSDYEYRMLLNGNPNFCFNGLHKLGIKIVVVTENCNGGQFSYHHGGVIFQDRYSALKNSNFISEVGAGDWFLAGFVSRLIHEKKVNADQITLENVKSWIKFASLVAGLKVGYFGASSGPTEIDLKQYVL